MMKTIVITLVLIEENNVIIGHDDDMDILFMIMMWIRIKVIIARVENFEGFFRKSLFYSQSLTPTLATLPCTGQQR